MGSWDLPIKEREFEVVLTQIVIDTIKLDLRFSQIISLYFVNDAKFNEFNSELLEKEFFSLHEKAKLIDYLAKNKLQSYPTAFLEKIKRCLEIRNKLVHTLGIEEDKSGKKEKFYLLRNGKERLRLYDLETEYYALLKLILPVCMGLKRLLLVEVVSNDIKSCSVLFEKGNEGSINLFDAALEDSQGRIVHIYDLPKRVFNDKDYETDIKNEIEKYLHVTYPATKNKQFTIHISELEIPEPEYPDAPEDS